MKNNRTPMRRNNLLELVAAIQENERRGYEVTAPIKTIKSNYTDWSYSRKNDDFRDFSGVSESEYYYVEMRRRKET